MFRTGRTSLSSCIGLSDGARKNLRSFSSAPATQSSHASRKKSYTCKMIISQHLLLSCVRQESAYRPNGSGG